MFSYIAYHEFFVLRGTEPDDSSFIYSIFNRQGCVQENANGIYVKGFN